MISSRAEQLRGYATDDAGRGSFARYTDRNLSDVLRIVSAIEWQEARMGEVPTQEAYMRLRGLLTMLGVAVVRRLPPVKWEKVGVDRGVETWLPTPRWANLGSHFIRVEGVIVHARHVMSARGLVETEWRHVETLRETRMP